MVGVVVQLNDSAATATDIEGRFSFSKLSPGTYRIRSSYLGYQSVIRMVNVTNDNVTTVTLVMQEAGSDTIGEVEIVVTIRRDSEPGYYMDQKNNAGLSDGTTAKQISRSPDRVVSDVLKRVSGASIQDNKFVVIRGLSDRYNTALINGMPLPSTEPDRKAFSFDIFPAVMLDNMSICKTATPDLPGDFAGGAIQLTTRDIPDSSSLSLGAGAGYNSQSTFKGFKTYQGGKRDWLGIDDGTRALPDTIPDPATLKELLKNPSTRFTYSKMFPNDWSINEEIRSPLMQSYQGAFATHMKLFGNELGITGALIYNNARRMQHIERADYDNGETAALFEYIDEQYRQNVQWGGMMNFAYKLDSIGSKFSWKNMMSITAEDVVVDRNGINYQTEKYEHATAIQFTSNMLMSSQLSGEHYLHKKKIRMSWGAGYSKVKRDMPDLRRMIYTKNVVMQDSKADTLWEAYVPVGAASPNYAGKFWSYLDEELYSGSTGLTIPFNMFSRRSSFKMGGAVQLKSRSFNARYLGYTIANPASFNWDLLYLPQDSIFAEENIGPKGFKLSEGTAASDTYTASSGLYAGYAMLDQKITDLLRAVYGVRVESFGQKLDALNYSGDTIAVDTTYIDVLPSLNLTYALSEKANLRLAGSRTVARPEFREIAPFSFYDFNTSTAVVGNEKLVRTNITNLDARYEIYPGFGQLLSVTAFYKSFINPIESVAFYGGSGSRTRTYQNAAKAINYGAELEFRTKLNRLDSIIKWKQWDAFTLFANLAYIRSEVDLTNIRYNPKVTERPLQGQSPYIINTGINYLNERSGTGFSILLNRIGRRISDVGADGYLDIYEAPRTIIDMQVSQRLLKNGEIKINAGDLLNRSAVFYQDENGSGKYEEDRDKKITGMRFGTNISISASYRF